MTHAKLASAAVMESILGVDIVKVDCVDNKFNIRPCYMGQCQKMSADVRDIERYLIDWSSLQGYVSKCWRDDVPKGMRPRLVAEWRGIRR